jgi:aspartate aminotransferase-like enzyme
VNWEKRFAEIAEWSKWLRGRLTEMGFNLTGNGALTSPAVITIALPPEMSSTKIGEAMQEAGYLLSCHSEYLRRKNWIQVCLMGECTREKVVALANALNRVCFQRRNVVSVTLAAEKSNRNFAV